MKAHSLFVPILLYFTKPPWPSLSVSRWVVSPSLPPYLMWYTRQPFLYCRWYGGGTGPFDRGVSFSICLPTFWNLTPLLFPLLFCICFFAGYQQFCRHQLFLHVWTRHWTCQENTFGPWVASGPSSIDNLRVPLKWWNCLTPLNDSETLTSYHGKICNAWTSLTLSVMALFICVAGAVAWWQLSRTSLSVGCFSGRRRDKWFALAATKKISKQR